MQWILEDQYYVYPDCIVNEQTFPKIYSLREGSEWLHKLNRSWNNPFFLTLDEKICAFFLYVTTLKPKRWYKNKFGLWVTTDYKRTSKIYIGIPKSLKKFYYARTHIDSFIAKYGEYFKLDRDEFSSARHSWGLLIKQIGEFRCVICNTTKNLVAHHLIYISTEPKLALNMNNGIVLCKLHHKEVHLLDWFNIN